MHNPIEPPWYVTRMPGGVTVTLAAYLGRHLPRRKLHDAGRASSSASMAAAACFRAKLVVGSLPPASGRARVLAGYRRTVSDRGRGQARPFGVSEPCGLCWPRAIDRGGAVAGSMATISLLSAVILMR